MDLSQIPKPNSAHCGKGWWETEAHTPGNATAKWHNWSSHCGAAEMNPTSIHEAVRLIPGLAPWVKVATWLQARV